MLIKTRNILDQVAPVSYLTTPVSAGGTILPIRNPSQYAASWGIQIGKTGEETAEVLVLSAATPQGTALTTAGTTRFNHETDSPVYAIKYDQIVFERSTSGTAGTATPMANGTVTITPDNTYTLFDDTTGTSTYAYKTYFRASILGLNSTESDWMIPTGFSFYSKAKIRQRTRAKLFDSSFIPLDSDIDDWTNEWLEVMTNAAIDVNKDYSQGTVDVAFSGTAQLGTISATDYKDIRRVWMTTDGAMWYNAQKKDLTGFDPNQTFSNSNPYYFFQGDNVIGRLPHDSSGTARLVYYKLTPVLVNDTDELPVVMHGYTKSFVDYNEAQARKRDGKMQEAVALENNANQELRKFVTQITPRSSTGVIHVESIEPLSGED